MTRRQRRGRRRGRATLAVWSIVAGVVLAAAMVTGIAVAASGEPFPSPAPTSSSPSAPSESPTPTGNPRPTVTPTPEPVAPSPAAASCDTETMMSVWAHYDDDLIFMNPAANDAIDAGDCVRTVFLTAGDAGRGKAYAAGRELGIFRAYNHMRGTAGFWSERVVTLDSGVRVEMWSPDGDPRITLVFFELPDGFLDGAGFDVTGRQSLLKLHEGQIPSISPINGGQAITEADLEDSLAELIRAFAPAHLMTHVPGLVPALSTGDHSDHATTGTLVRAAAREADYPLAQVSYVVGYPSERLPANVAGDALKTKVETFRTYAANDPVVSCATFAACLEKRRFGDWLQRHYVKSERDLFGD